ncbi:unnamed protein product, partial [Prunus brigantina]
WCCHDTFSVDEAWLCVHPSYSYWNCLGSRGILWCTYQKNLVGNTLAPKFLPQRAHCMTSMIKMTPFLLIQQVNQKGWEHTKKIYLEDQTVRLYL